MGVSQTVVLNSGAPWASIPGPHLCTIFVDDLVAGPKVLFLSLPMPQISGIVSYEENKGIQGDLGQLNEW